MRQEQCRQNRLGAAKARRSISLAALWVLLAASGLVAAFAPSVGAAPNQTGGHDVPAWPTGWSWTYSQSFHYVGSSANVTLNESVTYTVQATQTYNGYDAYKVGISGSVTGGGGSASGYNLDVNGGSVSGTRYLRRSDLALIYETQTHHLSGCVHVVFCVSFSADATVNLTPSPVWRQQDFRLHAGDSWHTNESIAYDGGFSYSSSVQSGSSPFNGTMQLDATSTVSPATIPVPIGSVATDAITTSDAGHGTTDNLWWAPQYRNVAQEHMVIPLNGDTVTVDRSLSSVHLPAPSPALTATINPDLSCAGGPVTVSGTLSSGQPGVAVTATLDKSVLGAGQRQVVTTSTGAGGAYQATLTAPPQADGLQRDGALGSWGVVVDAGGSSAAATLEVTSTHCTSLAYTGAAQAPQATGATVSATLTDLATGQPLGGQTVTFSLSGGGSASATTDGAGHASTTLAVAGPPRAATLAVAFGGGSALAASSVVVPFTVQADPTATALTSSENPATTGDAVTFTAHVTSAAGLAGPPAGTVQFTVDGSNLGGPVALDGNGSATSPAISTLAIGDHTVTAQYSGNADFAPSSGTLTEHVHGPLAPTVTTLEAAPTGSVSGQPVTLTATVAPNGGSGTPSGTVTFTDGTTTIGTAPLASGSGGDRATLTVDTLAPGNHQLTASYAGDDSFASSVSAPVGVSVAKADTTTAVSASVNPSLAGQPVTYTVTVAPVAPGAGAPAGTVQLIIDGTPAGSPVTLSGGQATIVAAPGESGAHPVTATYSGDGNFNGSSGTLTQTVEAAGTTTVLVSSPNPSTDGQPVTFTATVSRDAPATGAASGLVRFTDGSTDLGSATLSPPTSSGDQHATITVSSLAVGHHSVVASYLGDADDHPSTSQPVDQTVNETPPVVDTATALSSSVEPSVHGQPVTFTATVTAASGVNGIPTGTVQFSIDGSNLGSPVALDGAGSATSPAISTLAAGNHTVVASYSGALGFSTSGNTLTQTVRQAATTTSVSSPANPSQSGQVITFTATVAPVAPGAGTPTGTVQFSVDGSALGPPVALTASGVAASPAVSDLAPGSHTVSATYSGSADFAGSTSVAFTQTVQGIPTSTALASSPNPSTFGQAVTLTATVTPGSGNGTPTGTVTFYDGSTAVGSAPLQAGGTATLTLPALAVGHHSLTASYSGDATYHASSSAAVTQVVARAPTALDAPQATVTTHLLGGKSTLAPLTVTLSSPSGPLAGRVVVFATGTTTMCTATTDTNGRATCSAPGQGPAVLANGGYTVSFAGSASYEPAHASAGVTRVWTL